MDAQLEQVRRVVAGRYDVERRIGEGAKAVVYLARDLKHDRPVALKVMRPELVATVGSERFLREIEIAANMSHPHILPLFDSGQSGEVLYYVMPHVEGESLRERLEREGQVPWEEAVQLARQVADALAYAHERGVVHRDIKPENILLEDGEAVVADFGIARAITGTGGGTLTATGMAVGTPLYMSPEQAMGDEHLDARSDIYSLGCVLHEMLTGQPPFTAPTAQAVIAQHLRQRPPSPRATRPEIPIWLEGIVHTTLAKSVDDRFQTAGSMSVALAEHTAPRRGILTALLPAWVTTPRPGVVLSGVGVVLVLLAASPFLIQWMVRGGGGAPIGHPVTNLGVLPFEDFSGTDNRHLAEGLTEYLTDNLGSVAEVTVVSPGTMRHYRDAGYPLDSIVARHELGTLIEGSVVASDEAIQVSVRLTDAVSGAQLASLDPLSRPWDELPSLMTEIPDEVARLLRREMGIQISRRSVEAATNCARCLEHFFRARSLRERADPLIMAGDTGVAARALDQADSLLVLAEGLDPDWVDPTLERAWVASYRARVFTPSPSVFDQERTQEGLGHLERVLDRQPSHPEALGLRGILTSYLAQSAQEPEDAAVWWEAARSDLSRAVELDPSMASAWSRLSWVYRELGELSQAKNAAERALEEDVWLYNDEVILTRLCQTSLDLWQPQEASRWCVEEGRRRFPEVTSFISAELILLAADVGPAPDPRRAWQLADTLVQAFRPHRRPAVRPLVLLDVAAVLARAGMADSARAVVTTARATAPGPDPGLDYREANVRLHLGEPEEAIRLLSVYLESRPNRKAVVRSDLWFRSLHDRPDFQALVEEPPADN